MPWTDYDYLGEGIEKTQKALRPIAMRIEDDIGADGIATTDQGKLFELEERTYSGFKDSLSRAELITRADTLAADIEALPDAVVTHSEKLVIVDQLREAVVNERRNEDPDQPFEAVGGYRF